MRPLAAENYSDALDLQGLSQLKRDLKHPTAANAKEVARQFESLFIRQMLKSMRAASFGGDLGGPQAKQYRALYDDQLAVSLSQGKGLGLAPIIEQQLFRQMHIKQKTPVLDHSLDPTRMAVRAKIAAAGQSTDGAPAAQAGSAVNTQSPAKSTAGGPPWKSPADFVKAILPAAKQAAEKLGITPLVLVAQAALETGWGQRVPRSGSGGSSYNLFGIKSGAGWQGAEVKVPTLEYKDGIAKPELASFRAYGSVQASFADYAHFVQSHPRYRQALESNGDPQAYAKALQDAGYATDPNYARKIDAIMNSEPLAVMATQM